MRNDQLVQLSRVRSLTSSGAARAIRSSAGLTLGEVAKAIGISKSALSRWERDERVPRGDSALRYCEFLDAVLHREGP